MAQHNLRLATQQLKARAQDIYKSRDVGILDVMLSSASFDDLVTQLNMMERLGNSDVDTVRSIAAYRRNIKNRRVKLEADKKAATQLVADRAAQKNQILALQARLEKLTKGLKAQIKQMQAQAALRAKLALIGYSGVIPKVDPNSPGHPEIVAIAQRYLGVPYVWGGASPSGFDCSGLVMYCYAQIGIGLSHGATDQQRSSTAGPAGRPAARRPGLLRQRQLQPPRRHLRRRDDDHRGAAHRRRRLLRLLRRPRRLDRRPALAGRPTLRRPQAPRRPMRDGRCGGKLLPPGCRTRLTRRHTTLGAAT